MPVSGVAIQIVNHHEVLTPVSFDNVDTRYDGMLYRVLENLLA